MLFDYCGNVLDSDPEALNPGIIPGVLYGNGTTCNSTKSSPYPPLLTTAVIVRVEGMIFPVCSLFMYIYIYIIVFAVCLSRCAI